MVYSVYTTETFDKEILKLTNADSTRIEKMFLQLRQNPYVGDQLRYKNLREKRMDGKRIYYLVYDDLRSVLIVVIGGKKDQQATINNIIKNFDGYRIYLEKLLRKN